MRILQHCAYCGHGVAKLCGKRLYVHKYIRLRLLLSRPLECGKAGFNGAGVEHKLGRKLLEAVSARAQLAHKLAHKAGIGNFLRIQAGCIEHQRKIGYAAGENIIYICGNAQYVPLFRFNGLGAVSGFAQLKLRNSFKRFLAVRRGLALFQPFLVGDYLGLLFIRKLSVKRGHLFGVLRFPLFAKAGLGHQPHLRLPCVFNKVFLYKLLIIIAVQLFAQEGKRILVAYHGKRVAVVNIAGRGVHAQRDSLGIICGLLAAAEFIAVKARLKQLFIKALFGYILYCGIDNPAQFIKTIGLNIAEHKITCGILYFSAAVRFRVAAKPALHKRALNGGGFGIEKRIGNYFHCAYLSHAAVIHYPAAHIERLALGVVARVDGIGLCYHLGRGQLCGVANVFTRGGSVFIKIAVRKGKHPVQIHIAV